MKSEHEGQGMIRMELDDPAPCCSEAQVLEGRLRWAQESQALAVRILNLLNTRTTGKAAVRAVLMMVKDFTGFEAVAIRLRDGDDFPYYVTNGFPHSFVEAERYLCDHDEAGEIVRDENGNPALECMCGNILCGRTDPAYSFFTDGGSFWSCHTTELLATTTDEDRQTRTRNRCNASGYESVALIPLRSQGETIGLLQLNDSRKDCFNLDMITFFEGIGASIGIVLARVRNEEALQKAREELEAKVAERTEDLRKSNELLNMELIDRKRAERALRESEKRYRAVFDIASVGIDLVDRNGRFLDANDTLSKYLGYTLEELRQLTILDVTHPEDVEKTREMHDAIVQGLAENYRLEKRHMRKDGTAIWSDTAVSAIRGADGEYRATVGVIQDISTQKKSEEARVRLAAAVEQAVEGIVITDTRGYIEYVNPAYEEITGYSQDEVLGRKSTLLIDEEGDSSTQPDIIATLARAECWSGHLVKKRKDGRTFEEDVTVIPVLDPQGRIANYVAVKRDVTKEVGLQRQLVQAQKMEAIGTLAGGVAHDFNNILQVTLGYTELLLCDESLPERLRSDLSKVHESAKRGADLVESLLTFSRKTEIKPQPLNLNQRIKELRKILGRTVPKMIDIQLRLYHGLATLNADPTQIDQVLMNLVVNSRDAMPDGGKLTIETSNILLDEEYAKTYLDGKPGLHVLLSVTDTGTGMTKDTLEHIFEPFHTTKAAGEGTGLGLAMVHGIVKQHGGHVRCYSEPGEGTEFRIYLPALVITDEVEQIQSETLPQGGSETILLVDDEKLIRDLGSRILRDAGYTVFTASDGKEALDVFRGKAGEISLVVLDVVMPGMGGKQCLAELLAIAPDLKVVIASGYSPDVATHDALTAGAKGFVNKPYNIRRMMEVVRAVLDGE